MSRRLARGWLPISLGHKFRGEEQVEIDFLVDHVQAVENILCLLPLCFSLGTQALLLCVGTMQQGNQIFEIGAIEGLVAFGTRGHVGCYRIFGMIDGVLPSAQARPQKAFDQIGIFFEKRLIGNDIGAIDIDAVVREGKAIDRVALKFDCDGLIFGISEHGIDLACEERCRAGFAHAHELYVFFGDILVAQEGLKFAVFRAADIDANAFADQVLRCCDIFFYE